MDYDVPVFLYSHPSYLMRAGLGLVLGSRFNRVSGLELKRELCFDCYSLDTNQLKPGITLVVYHTSSPILTSMT